MGDLLGVPSASIYAGESCLTENYIEIDSAVSRNSRLFCGVTL